MSAGFKNVVYTDEEGEAHSAVASQIRDNGKADLVCQLNGKLETLEGVVESKSTKPKPNSYRLA